MNTIHPQVGIVMGSTSDWSTMQAARDVLIDFGVACEVNVLSAHRNPDDMAAYAKSAHARGLKVLIAGAGGAAHLPGMLASHTILPVIGVPVESRHLKGLDSLLSIVQMPGGVPVATVAIGNAQNAALLAISFLAAHDSSIATRLSAYRQKLTEASRQSSETLLRSLSESGKQLIRANS